MEAAADAKRKNNTTLQWITKRVRWAKRMKRVRTIQCRLMGRPSVLVGWYPQWLRLSLFSCPVWFLHSATPRFTVLKACKENRRTVFSASTWVEKPMKDYWRFEPEPNVTLVILHYAKDRPGTVSGTSMSCTRNSNFQTWNGVMLLCTSTLEEGWTLALSSAQISMIPFNNNEENTAVFFLYKQPVLKPMYNKIDHDRTRRVRSETWLYQKVWLLNGYARGSLYMLYLLTLWKYGCWWFFTFIFIFFLLKRSLFSLFVRYQHFQYLQGNEYVLRGILFETLTGCMSFQGTNMKVF